MARIAIRIGMVFLLFLGACTEDKVMDVPTELHSAPEAASLTQIQAAVHKAGARLGWGMKRMSAGRMEGRLAVRDHVAVVEIAFDETTFSITYRDSINLDYDGKSIHPKYNGWIANLRKAIVKEVSRLRKTG